MKSTFLLVDFLQVEVEVTVVDDGEEFAWLLMEVVAGCMRA